MPLAADGGPRAGRARATCSASPSRCWVDGKDPDAKPLPVGQDDGPPPPLLHDRPGRGGARAASAGSSSAGAARSTRAGSSARRPPAVRARFGVRQRGRVRGAAPAWMVNAMVMNHYERPKRFYVRTKIWYTTEPLRAAVPGPRSATAATSATAWPTTCPAMGSRTSTARTWTVPCRRAGDPRRRVAPPRRRDAPDAADADLRADAVRRARLLRRRRAHPYNTIAADPARGARGRSRQRDVRGSAVGVPVAAGELLGARGPRGARARRRGMGCRAARELRRRGARCRRAPVRRMTARSRPPAQPGGPGTERA